MANFLQQIKLDEELYDLHDSEFIIDNRSAGGAALTGVSKAPALFDGMQITYWLAYAAGSNATLNLTLADGTTTGAIPCYYSGTTRLTTHYAAGNAIRLIYRENVTIGTTTIAKGWWGDANYYSDTNYDIFGASIKVDTRINQYSLCAITGTTGTIAKQTNTNEAGTYWEVKSFTQSAGNGTAKKAYATGYYPYQILYNTSSSSYTTDGGASSTLASGSSNIDLRYTVNGSTTANIGVAGAPFFLVGTFGQDGLFYLKGNQATTAWWTCGLPVTPQTDYVYWFVGVMSSAYQVRLSDRNWFIKWSDATANAHLIYFEPWVSVDWANITGKPETFPPTIGTTSTTAAAGNHTHGYISNNGSIADAMATTPASGDKILISDLTDSNKVKGGPEIGSNDGKFLRHDGAWDTPDDHILVMTGTPTGGLDSAPIITTTTWNDYITAITNHDRLVLDIPAAHSRIEFQAQRDDGSTVNVLYAITNSGTRIVTSASYNAEEDANGFVVFTKDDSTVSFSQFAGEADSADYVAWNNIGANPYPVSAPPDNGDYSLNVSNGTTSWTAASSGPNTPDAPVSDGNYVLNVDSGSSSWQEEEKEVVEIVFDRGTYVPTSYGTQGALWTSLMTYQEVINALQNKIVRIKIPGEIIDALSGGTGSYDIIDLVTSFYADEQNKCNISYVSSVQVRAQGAGIEIVHERIYGEALIYDGSSLDIGPYFTLIEYLLGQSWYQDLNSVLNTSNITLLAPSVQNGLLNFATSTETVVNSGHGVWVLATGT